MDRLDPDDPPAHWLEGGGCLGATGMLTLRFSLFSLVLFGLWAPGMLLGAYLERDATPLTRLSTPVLLLLGPWTPISLQALRAVVRGKGETEVLARWASHNLFLRMLFPVACHRSRHRLKAEQIERELEIERRQEAEREAILAESWRRQLRESGQIYFVEGGPARTAADADDFEEVCAEFMRSAGFPDAERTAKGPDGGADILSADAIGQAKFYSNAKIGPEVIQQLEGARSQFKKQRALCFSWGMGYTDSALATAADLKIACFQFNPRRVDGQGFDRVM